MKTTSKISDLDMGHGRMTSTNKEKADTLNSFFCSVFTRENYEDTPTLQSIYDDTPLDDITLTEEIIKNKLLKLNPNKSPGPDGWHPRVFKETAEALTPPLLILLRKSLDEGSLPDDWKTGNITAIYKKGSKANPGNYHPISLTSIICKLLEAIIRDAIVTHMSVNNLFCDQQHGFVPGRSCITQLLTTFEIWTQAVENGNPVDAIYLDFQKAFDSVPHHRLIRKLAAYGVTGKILRWIETYLTDRKQRVCVEGSLSNWEDVLSGIPQGSVLGPTLFVMFINDMPDAITSLSKMFADDAKVFRQIENRADIATLQKDLDHLTDWSLKWQMNFNIKKCKRLHIGQTNPHNRYTIAGIDLDESDQERDLGIIVDNKLKFHIQTAHIVNKGFNILGIIKKSFENLDEHTVPILYKTLVRPILEYGNIIWGPHYIRDKHQIDRVQHRATRLVPGFDEISYEERLRRLKLPLLQYKRKRGDMIQTFKIMRGFDRIDPAVFFKFLPSQVTRGHSFKIHKQHAQRQVRSQSYSIRVINDWNNLPAHVVNAETVTSFKKRLDNHWESLKYSTDCC